MKVLESVRLIVLFLCWDAAKSVASTAFSFKIRNDMKSRRNVTSSIEGVSIEECVVKCISDSDCKSVQYYNGMCEFLHGKYSCFNLDSQQGWRYVYLGKC